MQGRPLGTRSTTDGADCPSPSRAAGTIFRTDSDRCWCCNSSVPRPWQQGRLGGARRGRTWISTVSCVPPKGCARAAISRPSQVTPRWATCLVATTDERSCCASLGSGSVPTAESPATRDACTATPSFGGTQDIGAHPVPASRALRDARARPGYEELQHHSGHCRSEDGALARKLREGQVRRHPWKLLSPQGPPLHGVGPRAAMEAWRAKCDDGHRAATPSRPRRAGGVTGSVQ